jgi:hypothetical protein
MLDGGKRSMVNFGPLRLRDLREIANRRSLANLISLARLEEAVGAAPAIDLPGRCGSTVALHGSPRNRAHGPVVAAICNRRGIVFSPIPYAKLKSRSKTHDEGIVRMGDGSGRLAANQTTDWSLIGRAAGDESPARNAAITELLSRYLPALRVHLIFQRRLNVELVEDLLQGFVASRLLEKELVRRADRQRGKFRNLLLTALDRYACSVLRSREHRDSIGTQSLGATDDVVDPCTQRDVFDEAWALGVWAEGLRRMKARCQSANREDLWGIFESRALLPALDDRPPLAYAELVVRFNFRSPIQAANAFGTAKQMFERIVRSVVAEYCDTEDEIVDEIRDLKRILGRSDGTLQVVAREILGW